MVGGWNRYEDWRREECILVGGSRGDKDGGWKSEILKDFVGLSVFGVDQGLGLMIAERRLGALMIAMCINYCSREMM